MFSLLYEETSLYNFSILNNFLYGCEELRMNSLKNYRSDLSSDWTSHTFIFFTSISCLNLSSRRREKFFIMKRYGWYSLLNWSLKVFSVILYLFKIFYPLFMKSFLNLATFAIEEAMVDYVTSAFNEFYYIKWGLKGLI